MKTVLKLLRLCRYPAQKAYWVKLCKKDVCKQRIYQHSQLCKERSYSAPHFTTSTMWAKPWHRLEWGLRMWGRCRKPHSITTSTNTSSYYAHWHQSAGLEISVPSLFFINLPNPASTCAPRKWRPAFPMNFTSSVSQVFLEPYFSYNILPNHH